MGKKLCALLLFTFIVKVVYCQEPTINRNVRNANEIPGTVNFQSNTDTIPNDTTTAKRNTFKTIFQGKPGKAALYSLLIPGGGQAYNKKWWKIPLALGIDGYLTYNLINKRKIFRKNDYDFRSYTEAPVPMIPPVKVVNDRSNSRREKEYALVYLIIGHVITVFDAYVDRHLLEFDLNENISVNENVDDIDLPVTNLISFTYKF